MALATATAAWSFSEAGYSIELAPAATAGRAWLLVLATEQSQPNPARRDATPPVAAPVQQRRWLLVDRQGRLRCAMGAGPADEAGRWASALDRMRARCAALAQPGAGSAEWIAVPAQVPGADPTWTARQACRAERCMTYGPQGGGQITLHGRRSLAADPGTRELPARARCIADRWLIVTNVQDLAAAETISGARFEGLPPPVSQDSVGHEAVRIDGIARVPEGFRCG